MPGRWCSWFVSSKAPGRRRNTPVQSLRVHSPKAVVHRVYIQRVLSFFVDREHPRRPLAVVIFEDLQWIDTETQALLNLLADSIATGKVLLLVNYLNTRPDAGQMRVFHAEKKRILKTEDSLAERSEFELPVPVSKLSDDSIELELATTRGIALMPRRRYSVRGSISLLGVIARYHLASSASENTAA